MPEKMVRKTCEYKERFKSSRAAHGARRNINDNDSRLKVYRCTHCKGWHVGHVAPNFKKKSDRKGRMPDARAG